MKVGVLSDNKIYIFIYNKNNWENVSGFECQINFNGKKKKFISSN